MNANAVVACVVPATRPGRSSNVQQIVTFWLVTLAAISLTDLTRVRLSAQPPVAFEVASIKPNKSGPGPTLIGGGAGGGRFAARNVRLRDLMRVAYRLKDFQMIGGPGWIDSDRYDVIAKAPDAVVNPNGYIPPDALRPMLQALLADRFHLSVHNEARDMPVYLLLLSRSDGRLGDQLRRSGDGCAPMKVPAGAPPPPPPPPGPPPADPPGKLSCPGIFGPGWITLRRASMNDLADGLGTVLRRQVVDRTALDGIFDVDVEFTPDQLPPPPPGAPAPSWIDPNGPSIFTAVQEQLGLKLESSKGPVEVLVIDHAEPPTPD
jgi:uncharacterized protein (TIGR03435 family)